MNASNGARKDVKDIEEMFDKVQEKMGDDDDRDWFFKLRIC